MAKKPRDPNLNPNLNKLNPDFNPDIKAPPLDVDPDFDPDPNVNFDPNLKREETATPIEPEPVEDTPENPANPYFDRKKFYDTVRAHPFNGTFNESQKQGMDYLLFMWEKHFQPNNPNDGVNWLAYCLATAYHETAATMQPIAEYGEGAGKAYGEPCGPYNQVYHGRGYVQITWEDNYKKGEGILRDKYAIECPIHQFADRAMENEPAAMLLFDGSVYGWFTGVSLQDYFSKAKGVEDAYNARRVINGTDKADLIKGYWENFKAALT